MKTPFLSIYTPTYSRPLLLAQCKQSVEQQTLATEHVIIIDEVGIGCAGMHVDIKNHAHKCNGEYVMCLSDDNTLVDEHVSSEMMEFAKRMHMPEVIILKGDVCGVILPSVWDERPAEGGIDFSNYVVHNTVWTREKDAWGDRYEGDFDFIDHLWSEDYRFEWWDRLAFRAHNVMRGRPE